QAVLPADESVNSRTRLKVFLRIRQCADADTYADNYQSDPSDERILWVETAPKRIQSGLTQAAPERPFYQFSRIFDGSAEQWPVFQACALPLLLDFVRGKNSLLFTYGITSSGKSYTMRGNRANPGLIPLSLSVLFATLEAIAKRKDNDEEAIKYKPAQFSGLVK
ncbi:Kinesin, motor region domain protein, partial [mine drainage metagenome]